MSKWSEYDGFLEDAAKDDRVGDHNFLVESVAEEAWPSGDPRFKIRGVLTTAGDSACDLTWSPPPPASVLSGDGMERGKKRAIAMAINIAKSVENHYGKAITQLKQGDVLRVKTAKTKIEADGRGGYIRIIAVLAPAANDTSKPPF